jgi:uncharacterized membrane protein
VAAELSPRRTPARGGSRLRTVGRVALAGFLLAAGTAHLVAPEPFLAQTPAWLPARRTIVAVSGLVELLLGVALLVARRHRGRVGWVVAGFLVAVFPGNVNQALTGADAFGLDTPAARWTRLAFQPVMIAWALWSTSALRRDAGTDPAGEEAGTPAVPPTPTSGPSPGADR